MADEDKSGSTFKNKILVPVVLAVLVGGSGPWWFTKVFPPANLLPTISVGDDQTIELPRNMVTLDGSSSTDRDGQIVNYLWAKDSGPSQGALTDPNVARTPVTGLSEGTYVFRLTITDDRGGRSTGIVIVDVKKAAGEGLQNRRLSVSKSISLFGEWGTGSPGDNEMDTDAGEVVPVMCRTVLSFNSREVVLSITYKIVEDGFDHTKFDHTVLRTVFPPPNFEGRILDIDTEGSRHRDFNAVSHGQNHALKSFQTDGSYWEYLKYRVDGPGDDNNTIGVEGKLNFVVILEP